MAARGDAAPATGGLQTRVVVGVALAAVAIAAVWAGGLAFTALVMAAVLLMSAEWSVMHRVPRGFRLASLVALAFTGAMTVYVGAADALIVLAAAAGLLGLFVRGYDRKRAFWVAAGLLYCGLPMVALLWLRGSQDGGGIVAWIFVVVWATDIGAFFAGRVIGGAKLAPSISPNKTLSGLAGGIIAAMLGGAVAAHLLLLHAPGIERWFASYGPELAYVAVWGGALAILAQFGDLFESWLKRRAGVKDSGTTLPGHGGVMDRIDGLVPVVIVVALFAAVNQ